MKKIILIFFFFLSAIMASGQTLLEEVNNYLIKKEGEAYNYTVTEIIDQEHVYDSMFYLKDIEEYSMIVFNDFLFSYQEISALVEENNVNAAINKIDETLLDLLNGVESMNNFLGIQKYFFNIAEVSVVNKVNTVKATAVSNIDPKIEKEIRFYYPDRDLSIKYCSIEVEDKIKNLEGFVEELNVIISSLQDIKNELTIR